MLLIVALCFGSFVTNYSFKSAVTVPVALCRGLLLVRERVHLVSYLKLQCIFDLSGFCFWLFCRRSWFMALSVFRCVSMWFIRLSELHRALGFLKLCPANRA